MLRKVFASLLIIFVAMALASCGSTQEEELSKQTPDTTAKSVETETVHSEFTFSAYDIDGNLRSSNEWVGKQPVVLNFWGTWCPPCRKEIPDLIRIYSEFEPQGIEIIGLAVRDQPGSVSKFSFENGMNWVMLMGDASLAMRYKITGVPTTIFIDRNGNEVVRFVGPRDYETFKKAFQAIL